MYSFYQWKKLRMLEVAQQRHTMFVVWAVSLDLKNNFPPSSHFFFAFAHVFPASVVWIFARFLFRQKLNIVRRKYNIKNMFALAVGIFVEKYSLRIQWKHAKLGKSFLK